MCLGDEVLEDVAHGKVENEHGLRGNAVVRVNLLEHIVDLDGV